MSVRNFWTVLLKLLGIWLVLQGVVVLPQVISAIPFFGRNNNENLLATLYVLGLVLLTFCFYIFVLRLFVFKTSWLIDKLKLENGFNEERIEFNIKNSSILTIAIIVIGGLIFVDSFPLFCRQVFKFFQQKNMFNESPSSGWIIFELVKTIIGYLLMTNSKLIVKFIEKQDMKVD
jgi:hypothetical protein